MHHSEKPMPGTWSAVMIVVCTGALGAAFLIGSLAALAQGASWLFQHA